MLKMGNLKKIFFTVQLQGHLNNKQAYMLMMHLHLN